MNRISAIILGAAAFAPAAALLVTAPAVWSAIAGSADAQRASAYVASQLGPVGAAAALAFPLAIFFIWHSVYRNGAEGVFRKVAWILAVVLLAPASLPVYWWTRFWTSRSERSQGGAWSSGAARLGS